MAEASRNRFNIPLDAAGAMANVMKWPWYWRYPMSLVGTAACLWLTVAWLDASPRDKWTVLLIGGAAVLTCVSLMYELLLLGIFVGLAYGAFQLVAMFFSDSHETGLLSPILFGGGVYVVYSLYQLRVKVEDLGVKMEALRQSNEAFHAEFGELLANVRWQNERRGQKFSETWNAVYGEPMDDDAG